MTKREPKQKKWLTPIALVLTAVLSVSLTYAWFTAQSSGTAGVSMGNMRIGSSFTLPCDVAEPGLVTDLDGTVKNNGSIGVLIKMDIEPTAQINWKTHTENGIDILDEWIGDNPIVIENDPNITLGAPRFNNSVPSMAIDDATGDFYLWMKHKTRNEYYLLIEGNTFDVPVLYEIAFSGEMGNKYQDADISIDGSLLATQWWADGALQSAFGIVFDDLEDYPNMSGRSVGGNTTKEKIMQRIAEIRAERQ